MRGSVVGPDDAGSFDWSVDHGLLAGLPLAGLAPGLEDGLLIAVTERRTKADVDRLADAMAAVLADLGAGEARREGEGVAR